MPSTLKVSEQPMNPGDDYMIIKFAGAFDKAGYGDINNQFDAILSRFSEMDNSTVHVLVFDFSDLDYINSQGIGIVMEINNKLKETGKNLVIFGLKPNVKDVFNAIGMDELVQIYDTLKDYMEHN